MKKIIFKLSVIIAIIFVAVFIIFKEVSSDGLILSNMPSFIQSNKEVVMAAVSQNGMALQYASEDLQSNKEVVMTAVSQDGAALQYASTDLRTNKEVVTVAVSQNGYALKFTSAKLKADKDVVMTAVSANYCYGYDDYKFFYDEFTEEFVLVPVSVIISSPIIELASSKDDITAYVLKVCDDYENYSYDDYGIVTDENGYQISYKVECCSALQYASQELRADKEIVMNAVAKNGYALAFASSSLKNDKEVVRAAVAQNGAALQYASTTLKSDKDIVASMSHKGKRYYFSLEPIYHYNGYIVGYEHYIRMQKSNL